MSYQENRATVDLTIAITDSDTGIVKLPTGMYLVGLDLPDAFEATTDFIMIDVGMSDDGSDPTMKSLRDKDGAHQYVDVATASNNRCVPLDPDLYKGWTHVTLTATLTDKATAVAQSTAARVITGIVERF